MKDLEEEGHWCDEKLAVCFATVTALASLQEMHKALEDEMVWRHKSIEDDVTKVEVDENKLENSQILAEALYSTADPARAQEMEKFVPIEVIIQEMSSCFNHSNYFVGLER